MTKKLLKVKHLEAHSLILQQYYTYTASKTAVTLHGFKDIQIHNNTTERTSSLEHWHSSTLP